MKLLPSACPAVDSWKQFLKETLAGNLRSNLAEHLENCERCQATVERLCKGSTTWLEVSKRWRQGSPRLSPASDNGMGKRTNQVPSGLDQKQFPVAYPAPKTEGNKTIQGKLVLEKTTIPAPAAVPKQRQSLRSPVVGNRGIANASGSNQKRSGATWPLEGSRQRVIAGLSVVGVLVVGILVAASLKRSAPPTLRQIGPNGDDPFAIRAANPDEPLIIRTHDNTDEVLFLVRTLAATYNGLDSIRANSEALTNRRQEIKRLHAHIQATDINDELIGLYGDCLVVIDAYQQFVQSLDYIENRATNQKNHDDFNTGFQFGFGAVDTYGKIRDQGAEKGDAALAALLLHGIEALIDASSKSQQRNEAKQRAIETVSQRLKDTITDKLARASTVCQRLTRRYAWKDGEAGFDGFTSSTMKELIDRRPRDPFLRVAHACSEMKDKSPADLLDDARACVEAAQMIPKENTYDPYRAWCLTAAGELATRSAANEIKDYSKGPVETGHAAVRIWRTVSHYQTGGLTDEQKAWLARALGLAGRYEDAYVTARSATQCYNDAYFCYRTMRLAALAGHTEDALQWLNKAFTNGYSDVAFARRDPDLANLRKNNADQLEGLLKVDAKYTLVYGLVNDDVTMVNNSGFTLTNVVVNARFELPDGRVWTRRLTSSIIRPGEEYKWKDCISIPKSKVSNWYADLECDQTK